MGAANVALITILSNVFLFDLYCSCISNDKYFITAAALNAYCNVIK